MTQDQVTTFPSINCSALLIKQTSKAPSFIHASLQHSIACMRCWPRPQASRTGTCQQIEQGLLCRGVLPRNFKLPNACTRCLVKLLGNRQNVLGHTGLSNGYVARLGWLDFRPGQEARRFLAVPEGARWAEMRFTAGPHEQPRCGGGRGLLLIALCSALAFSSIHAMLYKAYMCT